MCSKPVWSSTVSVPPRLPPVCVSVNGVWIPLATLIPLPLVEDPPAPPLEPHAASTHTTAPANAADTNILIELVTASPSVCTLGCPIGRIQLPFIGATGCTSSTLAPRQPAPGPKILVCSLHAPSLRPKQGAVGLEIVAQIPAAERGQRGAARGRPDYPCHRDAEGNHTDSFEVEGYFADVEILRDIDDMIGPRGTFVCRADGAGRVVPRSEERRV